MFAVFCVLGSTIIATAIALCVAWFGLGVTLLAGALVSCGALYFINPRR